MQRDDQRLESAPTNLEEALVGTSTTRRRAIQWAVLVVVVLTSLAFAVPSLAQTLPRLFAAPKNTAILVTSNLNWGTLSLDGLRTTSSGTPQVLMLASRAHLYRLTFAAAPFAAQSCLLPIPTRPDDSCHPINPADAPSKGIVNLGANASAVVDFALTPTNLSDSRSVAEVQHVVAAALQVRTMQTTVPAGRHYALTANGVTRISIATQPLAAQLVTMRSTQDTAICATFCAGARFAQPPNARQPQNLWNLRFAVRQRWHFTTPADATPLGTTDETLDSDLLDLTLAYAQGAWALPTMAPPPAPPNLCARGEDAFNALPSPTTILAVQGGIALENHAVEGCRLTVQVQPGGITQFSTLALLWRFGGLFTTDALSASLLPDLPSASAADLAALQTVSP